MFLFPRAAIAACPWREDLNSCHEFQLIFDLIRAGYEFLHTPFLGCCYHKAWKPEQIGAQREQRLRDREALQVQVWEYASALSDYHDSIDIGKRKLQADWERWEVETEVHLR